MFILSAALGQKYYPIPYKWGRLLAFFVLMGVSYAGMLGISELSATVEGSGMSPMVFRLLFNTVITATYAGAAWLLLRHRKTVAQS